MDDYKEVAFRNYDASTNFYYDETVNAYVWDGDFVMTSGYWVIDDTYSFGDATGQGDAMTHQILIEGDVHLIVEDGCSLTLRYNAEYKENKEELEAANRKTITGALELATGLLGGLSFTKSSKKAKATETSSSVSYSPKVDTGGIELIMQGIEEREESIAKSNAGTEVAMISVIRGNNFTVYGQEESSGVLDIEGTVLDSSDEGTGSGGAAIGGDGGEDSGIITINGCTVKAVSKSSSAAIGSGFLQDDIANCTGVTINGGDITAYCENSNTEWVRGAGIGGADDGWARKITINSGHVYAAGGIYAAGIGGGNGIDQKSCTGTFEGITINGGYVQAYGGEQAAGIGSGYEAGKGSRGITINNGLVIAVGGDGESYEDVSKISSYSLGYGWWGWGEHAGCGIGSGSESAGSKSGETITYAVSQLYFNGGNIYAKSGTDLRTGDSYAGVAAIGGITRNIYNLKNEYGLKLRVVDYTDYAYSAGDIYVDTDMTIVADGFVVENDGSDLTNDLANQVTASIFTKHISFYMDEDTYVATKLLSSDIQNKMKDDLETDMKTYTTHYMSNEKENPGGWAPVQQELLDESQRLMKVITKKYEDQLREEYQTTDHPAPSSYELTENVSDIGFSSDIVDEDFNITGYTGGGYVYLTDGVALINSEKLEFKNIYVNGDTAHGGVISTDDNDGEGGLIDLVNVDFTGNKVIHNSEEAAGGAIYSNGKYETILTRCSFTDNMASGYRLRSFGGAIAVTGKAMLTVKDTVLTGNKATSEGGAVWNNNNFVIAGSDFINNYANKGGAVYATSETLIDTKRIVDSTFAYNTANFGGAVFVDVGSSVSIENSEFIYNNAHSYGYKIESDIIDFGEHQGGAVYVDGNKDARKGGVAVISNTDFTGNYAKQGAGLYVDSYANVAVSYSDFIDNFAEDEGGAIYVAQNGTLALSDVYFTGNMSYITGLVEREKEVTVTTSETDDDGDSTKTETTKTGTYNEEVILTQYCAVYNEGEINFVGHVKVDPFCLDVLYNRGRVNWDLNGVTANGFFSDITLFTNEVSSGSYIGSFGITVNANDIEGVSRYVIAEHAVFDKMTEETAMTLKRFVLRGVDGELDKVIIADGNTVEYNGKTYRLYTTDAEHYNQLILSVEASETERTGHILVNRENFNGAVLNTAGEFTGFNYGDLRGGVVLLTEDSVFSAHDSTFSGNVAEEGGAIYTVAGSTTNLTNVTFSGNSSKDGTSGALYISAGSTVNMYGDVTLSTASDTITNYGKLVWNIGLLDNGYLSDYSLVNNTKYGSLVIADAPKAAYGKYKLADKAKSADGAQFLLSDGESKGIVVNSEEWVSCGNMEARIYVDANNKYSLWLEVRATRIDVNLETYTMRDNYTVDMTGSPSYEGDGGLICVHSNGRLQNEGSVKITGGFATGNGGVIYSQGNVSLSHTKILNSHSYSNGGAIYGEGIKITLTDSVFSGNSADAGGAIWNEDGTTILDNVTFNNNTAIGDGGAIYGGDIVLAGKVYLSTEKDTIWMQNECTLNWTIDGNDNGYISDYSLIVGNVDKETFTIDAFDSMIGHYYILAGNAAAAAVAGEEQTFTITVSNANGDKETYSMKVGGETLTVNEICYVLDVNEDGDLALSVNRHIVVENDEILLISSAQNFSWAGMGEYTGNGSIFEVQAGGIMTNIVTDGENTYSYEVIFADGSVTGNGGMIYNAGILDLDTATFDGNTAKGSGGAVYNAGQLVISEGTYLNNKAENGGAVYIAAGTDNYLSGAFGYNTASGKGGAIYLASGAALELGDATFTGNGAKEGGAIYSEGNILLTGELVLYSADDNFVNKGTVTLDYASNASIRGFQYLANEDAGKLCISVEGLDAGEEIWQYKFAQGDFSGDYDYEDEFILTDGTNQTTITVDGEEVEFNGLKYFVEVSETGDALFLNAYMPKTISVTLNDMEKMYDGYEMTCTDYTISGTLESIDDLVFTLSDSITDVGSKTVGISDWMVLRDGVDVSYEYSLTSTDCTLTVTPREILFSTGNAVKAYDGTPLTCDTVTISGDGFARDEGCTYTVTGSQTQIGVSDNTLQYKLNEGTKAENYIISENLGMLSVTGFSNSEITIAVDNNSRMYDGNALRATYHYTEGVLLKGDVLVVQLDNTAITDAGKVDVSVVKYVVLRGNEDVTGGYHFAQSVSGSLEITPRNISVETGSAEKVYDGTPLTCDTITITGDGFAQGEGWTYAVTGSQTEVGSSDNTFAYSLNSGTKAENYNITEKTGVLSVTAISDTEITIAVDSYSRMYDGSALKATYQYTPDVLLEGDELVVQLDNPEITDAGKVDVSVVKYTVMRGDVDVTGGYRFAQSVSGSLEVTKRNISVETGSAEKEYDGTPLTCDTVTISGDGFAQGEGWTYAATGSQTEIGTSDNTFAYTLVDGAVSQNYNITVKKGTLTVTDPYNIVVDNEEVDLEKVRDYQTITVQNHGILNVNAEVTTETLTVDSSEVNVNVSFSAGKATVSGKSNLTGIISAETLSVSSAARTEFDTASAITKLSIGTKAEFTADSIEFAENATVSISGKANVSVSEVSGTLNKLTVSSGTKGIETVVDMSFNGTEEADTVSIGNYVDYTADTIDLGAGADTVKVGTSSQLKADIVNLGDEDNTMTVGSKANVEITNLNGSLTKLTLSSGKIDAKTSMQIDELTGTANNDTVTIGNYAEFTADTIDLGAGADTVKVGTSSQLKADTVNLGDENNTMTVGSKANVEITNLNGSLTKLTLSSGKIDAKTSMQIDVLTGTANNDTVTIGNYAEFKAETVSLEDGNDTFKVGNMTTFEATTMKFGDGIDKITIGKQTAFTAGTIDFGKGVDTFTAGAKSEVSFESMENVNQFIVSSGSKDADTKVNVSGKISFDTAVSNKLTIANYTDVNVHNVIDFNGNTTTMSIGSNSTVVLKGLNAVNVSDFTVGVGSTAYLSSNLYAKVKLSSKGDYYDIGSSAVAVNFTDIDDENSDDTVARKLSGDYNGWLNDELDDVDTLKTGARAMTLDLGAGYKNFEVDFGEGYVSATKAKIAVEANTKFGIKLADDVKGSFAYTVTSK